MSETLTVLLGKAVVGEIVRLPGRQLQLTYDDGYRRDPGATRLSLSLPLAIASHVDTRKAAPVVNFMWGLLPDNELVLQRWARHYQVSPTSAFDLLGTPVGADCAGAARFGLPSEVTRVKSRSGEVTWQSEAEVAQRLRDLRQDNAAWLGKTFTGQFSLAGAQAKTALLYENGRWGLPSGSAATTHILKPAVAGFDDHDLNEHLCLEAARHAGLLVSRSFVVRFEDQTAIAVERYDRRVENGAVVRIHQEDLVQAMGLPPSAKYQNQGGPSPSDIVALFRRHMSPRAATDAVQRFTDALIWNWIIMGTDAHAKNYSVLISGANVRLAPLYDVASLLPYGYHEKKLKLAMKLGGTYDVNPWHNFWPKAAVELGLPADQVLERVRHLTAVAPAAFSEAAAAVNDLRRPLPPRLVDLIADRAARCANVVS